MNSNDVNKYITHWVPHSHPNTLNTSKFSCLSCDLYLGKMPLHTTVKLFENLRIINDWKEFWRKQKKDFYSKCDRELHLDEDLQVTLKLQKRKKSSLNKGTTALITLLLLSTRPVMQVIQ